MTPKPLDPCPVCGGPAGNINNRAWCDGNCAYDVTLADHRRLSAEVALARALEPEIEQFATSHRLNGHAAEADEWLRLVARVREASK